MALHERISNLIGRIYETADDPTGWPGVSADVLKVLCGRHLLITLTDTKNLQCSNAHYFGVGDARALIAMDEFKEEMCRLDPVLVYAEDHPDATYANSARLLEKTQFSNWYHDRFRTDYYLVGFIREVQGLTFGVSLHVKENKTAANEPLFRMLFRHMVRAAQLATNRIWDERENVPRLQLDGSGRITNANRAALELFEQRIGLQFAGGRLRAGNSEDDGNLQNALKTALGVLSEGSGSTVVRIRDLAGKHAFYVKVTPRPARATLSGMFQARVAVEIIPFASSDESGSLLPSFEELTAREAEVADLLVRGHSIETLATALDISINTAKIHLRGLFEKTGTNRQSDLIRTLLRLSGN